jgi:hypothetical protein
MPLQSDAFAHVRHLLGKIIEPEQSTFRITRAKYDEWDQAARAAGQPETWRRSHEDREATRVAALVKRTSGSTSYGLAAQSCSGRMTGIRTWMWLAASLALFVRMGVAPRSANRIGRQRGRGSGHGTMTRTSTPRLRSRAAR